MAADVTVNATPTSVPTEQTPVAATLPQGALMASPDTTQNSGPDTTPVGTNALVKNPPNLFQRVGDAVVNQMGQKPASYTEDAASGKLVKDASNATPGQLFKNMAVGMLLGISSAAGKKGGFLGGVGNGFAGVTDKTEANDDAARAKAVQAAQQQQAAQKATADLSTAAKQDAYFSAQTTHLNAATFAEHVVAAKGEKEQRQIGYDGNSTFEGQMLTNPIAPGQSVFKGLTYDQMQARMADHSNNPLPIGTTGRAVGERQVVDPQGKPVLDADGQPSWETLYDGFTIPKDVVLTKPMIDRYSKAGVMIPGVTPGQTISGIALGQLETNYVTKSAENLKQAQAQATIDETHAKTTEAYAGAGKDHAESGEAVARTGLLNAQTDDLRSGTSETPDVFGGKVDSSLGKKELLKRQDAMKPQADALSKSEQTYSQFNHILTSAASGTITGAQSVVALFDAVGISATPMKGMGFRINNDIIQHHQGAVGLAGLAEQKWGGMTKGTIITPQQIKDYAQMAVQARHDQVVQTVNQARNAGLKAHAFLPTGNGQPIDSSTAQIFMDLSGGDPAKARTAATAKGWK